jgi:hypothetical protein
MSQPGPLAHIVLPKGGIANRVDAGLAYLPKPFAESPLPADKAALRALIVPRSDFIFGGSIPQPTQACCKFRAKKKYERCVVQPQEQRGERRCGAERAWLRRMR